MTDWGSWEFALAGGLIGSGFLWLAAAAAQPNAARNGNMCFLTYGWPVKIITASLIPVAVFVIFVMAHAPAKQIALAFVFSAAFLAVTIAINYQIFFVRFGYDRNRIYFHSPFCEARSVPWENLESAGHSYIAQADYIEVTGVGRIWCPSVLNGHDEFGRFLEQKAGALIASQS
ncbi:hypothetical protein [Roseibium sp. MMSF_3544]|uniref:hypothetical protein n=1 Tax=unclassified Roseibium TaxID=2629323 RepID=UPI00273D0F38|nr:hypothetical protein [Roseibium sp. MMSF_3544]